MRLIEFHILQSFPVSCLNRDDVNSPKTVKFGGKTRARISSQCYKRAIRMMAKDLLPHHFGGIRTKNSLATILKEKLLAKQVDPSQADKQVKDILKNYKLDKDTQLFISNEEIESIINAAMSGEKFSWKKKKISSTQPISPYLAGCLQVLLRAISKQLRCLHMPSRPIRLKMK